MTLWNWLTKTDAGLFTRIGAGALFFLIYALIDLKKNGNKARRWREYMILVLSVFIALCYGAVNDQITVRISPEYFLYGKELAPLVYGHEERLPWEATKVGLKATWTVGLLIGVAILLANNPHRTLPQLPYPKLIRKIPVVILFSILFAMISGAIGHCGGLAFFSDDFHEMVRRNEYRPYRFMAVYGIHLGGYIGGLIGTIWAVVSIRTERYNNATSPEQK